MKINLILSFLIISSIALAEESCKKGKIKYTYKKELKEIEMQYCTDEDSRDKFIYSKNCKGLSCEQVKDPAKRPINLGKYPSAVGSPGFKVCRELGGSPQIIEYKINGKDYWEQSSRCIFNEETFVSNNLLIKLWKPYLLN